MQIRKQIDVNVSAEKAWAILQDLGTVDQWGSSVHQSKASGNGEGETRVCETDLGPFKETVVVFDETSMELSYKAEGDKMPFFVRHLQNNWKIEPTSADRCRVNMRLDCEIMFPFTIFPGPLMRMKFSSVTGVVVKEFKHFVETGKPSDTKLKAMRKAQRN